MNYLNPIYTEKRECQDCYKCVRNCPVKAIKVENGYASVIAELCILCGECVQVCPNHAKRVRDDLPQARQLLKDRAKVFVSLAPSFVSEFDGLEPGRLIHALKRLGFTGVSETALGAQQVSAQAARVTRESPGKVLVSSACPTVVNFLQRHRPQDSRFLTPLLSPLLTHCKLLRRQFGDDIGIVFIGPCIAKKHEVLSHPGLLDVALTFADLRRWFDQAGIVPAEQTAGQEDRFVPEQAEEGAWYAVDGGMIAGMKATCSVNDGNYMAFSGISAISKALDGLSGDDAREGLFLELLACEGGCVNGPQASCRSGTAAKRSRVLGYGRPATVPLPRPPVVEIKSSFPAQPVAAADHSEAALREALRLVGKFSRQDELNCGGCGYNSCREFGAALIDHKAERSMCVTYMRQLAHKKANALMQTMPSAVVIINDAMRVIDFNGAFARLFPPPPVPGVNAGRGLEGLMLSEVLPFANLFQSVLRSGEQILERDLRHQNTILHATIFTIEKHCVVGGILLDITEPAVRKAEVIRKAQEVIQKSLQTTQKIACLLGENAAESEITLNSIIESFSPPKPEEPRIENDWRKLYRH